MEWESGLELCKCDGFQSLHPISLNGSLLPLSFPELLKWNACKKLKTYSIADGLKIAFLHSAGNQNTAASVLFLITWKRELENETNCKQDFRECLVVLSAVIF